MLRRRREMRAAGKTVIIPEDDPNVYKQALHKKAVKVSIIINFKYFLYFSSLPIWSDYALKSPIARPT